MRISTSLVGLRLATASEIADMQVQFPRLQRNLVKASLAFPDDSDKELFENLTNVRLGNIQEVESGPHYRLYGAQVVTSLGRFKQERARLAQLLSDIAKGDVALPETDLFVGLMAQQFKDPSQPAPSSLIEFVDCHMSRVADLSHVTVLNSGLVEQEPDR